METTRKLAAVLALAVVATAGAVPAASGAPQTPSGFAVVASPAVSGQLTGVAAVSANNVWAVGGTTDHRTLVEHWTGAAWHVVTAPHPSPYSVLFSVSAGSGAVWAVGFYDPHGTDNLRGLAERWNGSSWIQVRIPASLGVSSLNAVHVFSDTNVWAGGSASDHHILLHYSNGHWTRIADVAFSGQVGDRIDGIAAGSPSQVFAIGDVDNQNDSHGLLEREVTSSNWQDIAEPSGQFSALEGVSASAAGNVWAVGAVSTASSSHPIAMHWNGAHAASISFPSSSDDHGFGAIVAISPTNVWAVGSRSSSVTGATDTLIDHYTGGSSFIDLGGPNPDPDYNNLEAITEVPGAPSNLWAVGRSGNSPLILHHM